MIIVTGGAGLIGSHLIRQLNNTVSEPIIVVDNLSNGYKFKNLVSCKIADFLDKDDFLQIIKQNKMWSEKISVLFHQGACTNTMEWNGKYMMANNYNYSKTVLEYCINDAIPFIYASSAAVYGPHQHCIESEVYENPLNIYGYSKLMFDNYVRTVYASAHSQVVGLRYFNVYGPGERHKESMASVVYHFNEQLKSSGKIKLFSGNEGYQDGEQRRDFIFVEDIVAVNLWCMHNPTISGIYNCGTGHSVSFNEVAQAIIDYYGKGCIEYIPFPEKLKGSYQSFTQADLSNLKKRGFDKKFYTIKEGVKKYLDQVNNPNSIYY